MGWMIGVVLFLHLSLVGTWTIFYLIGWGLSLAYKLQRPAYFLKSRSPHPKQLEIVYVSAEIASIIARLVDYDKTLFRKYSDGLHSSIYLHINREAEMEEQYVVAEQAGSLIDMLFASYMQSTMQYIVTERIYTQNGYLPITVTQRTQNYIVEFYPELILLNPVRFNAITLDQYAPGLSKVVDTLVALECPEETIRYEAVQWLKRRSDRSSVVLLPDDLTLAAI